MSDCGRCWKCKEGTGCIRSVSFGVVPGGARQQEVTRVVSQDKRWDEDMRAYKAMRANGIQPKRIDDCAKLEARANDQFEVEMAQLVPDRVKPQVKEGLAIVQAMEDAAPQVNRTQVADVSD